MKEIIFNPLLKLSNVNRYSGVYLLKPESVSDHTCQVGLMALVVANELNKKLMEYAKKPDSLPFFKLVNLEVLALKCMVHDIDESSLNYVDIPRNVKYANPEITEQFKKLEKNAVEHISEKLKFPQLAQYWKDAKDDTLEGQLVKLCDMLVVARKTYEEVVILGNKNMLRVALEVHNQSEKEILRLLEIPLDNSAESVIIKFFTGYHDSVLNILGDIIQDNETEISDYYFNSQE